MYELNKDFDVTGYLMSEAIMQPERSFGRDELIYHATIEPEDHGLRSELFHLLERDIQCHQKLEIDDQPNDKILLRFESIRRPNYGVSENGSVCSVGDRVTLQVRVETRQSPDGSVLWPRFQLRSLWVTPHEEPVFFDSPDNDLYDF